MPAAFSVYMMSARRVTIWLSAIATALVLASTGLQLIVRLTDHDVLLGLPRLFYLDEERNVPTAFSVLILLIAARLLQLTALASRKAADRSAWYWALLSAGFVAMALDEALQWHERLIPVMRTALGGGQRLGLLANAWVLPAGALVCVLGIVFARFLWRLPARTRTAFLLSAAIYLGGAVGVEMPGGRWAELHGMENLTYLALATIEETMEMAGVILFIRSLMIYREHYSATPESSS